MSARAIDRDVQSALAWLKRHGSARGRADIEGYGVPADRALGVSMKNIQTLARQLGRNHALAEALWKTGVYEARMLTAYVDEPSRVTSAQMDRWCRDFDNWAICDTLCFALFDRTPYAWSKVAKWRTRRDEFGKRAAFALLWALALHDKRKDEAPFVEGLRFIEDAGGDDRHYIRKALKMALRAIGRRSPALHAAAAGVGARITGRKGNR